jgi:hypothetical protein
MRTTSGATSYKQAVAKDENLAGIGLVEFGDDTAALSERCK